jgi:NAD(P)-dependent dehydrogenase (short-subunit alcohol dehydrogenase family)
MPKREKDRVALVTGAASGIGLATVRRLLEAGWKVAAVDRDEAALAGLSRELGLPTRVFTSALDVTDEAAAEKAVAMAGEALGGLDGVVNSAGIAADIHALETPVALLRKILDVNVVGTFIVARAAARLMKDRGGGAIVNISSVSGLRGGKGRSAYGASKGAVVVLTQVLANDLARYKIRVNAVAPGPVDTPMVKAVHTAADRALWLRHVPMRRYAEPGEIASVIEFLLDGTRSSFVTGEIVAVDGGFRGAGIIAEGCSLLPPPPVTKAGLRHVEGGGRTRHELAPSARSTKTASSSSRR